MEESIEQKCVFIYSDKELTDYILSIQNLGRSEQYFEINQFHPSVLTTHILQK
jgi:hypothetical protein